MCNIEQLLSSLVYHILFNFYVTVYLTVSKAIQP